MAKRIPVSIFDIQKAQTDALAYAKNYISNTPLGLPADLDDDRFAAIMNAITRGLVQAYAAGFMSAAEGKR